MALKRRTADHRINLSSNELLHPAVDAFLSEAISRLHPSALRRYPVTAALIDRMAAHAGVPADELLVTPGSDAAIRLVCRWYAAGRERPGTLVLQHPNYEAWEHSAAALGLPVVPVGTVAGDAEEQGRRLCAAARAHRDALVAVSVPNGPGGWTLGPKLLDELTTIAGERGHLLVIDSCYQAFQGPLGAVLRRRGGPVLAVQSLSKSHGLAGARVALLAADADRVLELGESQLEQTVSAASLIVAAELADRVDALRQVWAELAEVREDTARRLRSRGLRPLPSGGNFLTVDTGSVAGARAVTEGMSAAGYRIRDLSGVRGLRGCVRFTIADEQTTATAVATLLRVAAESVPLAG